MTPAQCRAARALAGITQNDLAHRAGVDRKVIIMFERDARSLTPDRTQVLRLELERAGVELLDGDQPGVRAAAGTVS